MKLDQPKLLSNVEGWSLLAGQLFPSASFSFFLSWALFSIANSIACSLLAKMTLSLPQTESS
jgi:hypothetical protein